MDITSFVVIGSQYRAAIDVSCVTKVFTTVLNQNQYKMAESDVFGVLWARILSKLQGTAEGQCWLWMGTMNKCGSVTYGVIRVKFPGRDKSSPIGVHRASYIVHQKSFIIAKHMHISHLCGTALCCNPDHLSQEPHHINNSRRNCHQESRCLGHGMYPPCIV